MMTQKEKGSALRALHSADKQFVVANAWDAGSACLLAAAGFDAIATTSAGFAFSIGKQDNDVGRDAILKNASDISAAVDLPVTGDLENGFGDDPETAAETIRHGAEAGLVGGSIEDSTYDANKPLYELEHSVDRVRAAVDAARALPFDFVLTARAENYLVGQPELKDVIRRLQAYQEAGADCLYAPGLKEEAEIREVIASVDRPVNVIVGLAGGANIDMELLADIGVRRISVGSAFARQAYGQLLNSAKAIIETGSFDVLKGAMSNAELNGMFGN